MNFSKISILDGMVAFPWSSEVIQMTIADTTESESPAHIGEITILVFRPAISKHNRFSFISPRVLVKVDLKVPALREHSGQPSRRAKWCVKQLSSKQGQLD